MPTRPPMHRPIGPRPGRAPTSASDRFYHTAAWQRICRHVLERDGFRCQLALFGCLGDGRTVDHIVERSAGGSDEPANLRTVCRPCHNRRHPEKGRVSRD